MLSSITPFGERGRNNRFGVTATFFVAGAILGGVALGTLVGFVGHVVVPDEPTAILGALALLAAAGALCDAGAFGLRVPTIRRQVDENWLQRYRGWVYGFGFGAQLGAALTTIVSSASVYLMVAAAAGSRSAVTGAAMGAVFGAIRGGSLLLARRVNSAEDLRTFHRRLATNAIYSQRVSAVTQGLVGATLVLAVVR